MDIQSIIVWVLVAAAVFYAAVALYRALRKLFKGDKKKECDSDSGCSGCSGCD